MAGIGWGMSAARKFGCGPVLGVLLAAALLAGCSGPENRVAERHLPDADMLFLERAAAAREAAWKQLNADDKAGVKGDWREARVSIANWERVPIKVTERKLQAPLKVAFASDRYAEGGAIGIYADQTTAEIVGYDEAEYASELFGLVVRGGGEVRLRSFEEEARPADVLGRPLRETVEELKGDGFTGSRLKRSVYDGLELELFAPPPQDKEAPRYWIMTMTASGAAYTTTAGIGPGSGVEELKAAYPEIPVALDGRTDPDNCAYVLEDEGDYNTLRFEVEQGKVKEVRVYHSIP